MHIWVRSLLAGAVITMAVFLLSGRSGKTGSSRRYSMNYTLEAGVPPNQANTISISKITGILKKRLDAAGWKHEITDAGNDRIGVVLHGIKDTLATGPILISNGRIQFREVYRIDQLVPMLQAFVEVMQESTKPAEENKIVTPVKRDSMSRSASELLDSMEIADKATANVTRNLVEFVTPYTDDASGMAVHPAEIGNVRRKDTAAVRKLFLDGRVRKLQPGNAQLFFGKAQKINSGKDDWIPLYFINTINDPNKALLENEDIVEATQDFDYEGRVMIRMEFSSYGAKKWAIMTRSNIGRPIAIIFNGNVISAPNVLSEIPDGASSISGNFSVAEGQEIESQLKSAPLPFNLSIRSVTVSPEPAGIISKKLLMGLLLFLLTSALAFLAFKALKSTPPGPVQPPVNDR